MTWDFVVVGAGSAGCVLAARLTEDPSVSVLLLEAGDRDTAREIGVPAAFSKLFKTRHDWDYTTEPEAGCDGRAMYWPRGKVLGGSSSINAMIYIRGARADYDAWRDAGCEGWGFDDVLPYFIRSEDNRPGPTTMRRFARTSAPTPRRSTTRPARRRWARPTMRSATRSCGCAASPACEWQTPRSCRTSRAATPAPPW